MVGSSRVVSECYKCPPPMFMVYNLAALKSDVNSVPASKMGTTVGTRKQATAGSTLIFIPVISSFSWD